jgi:hypothetical protein
MLTVITSDRVRCFERYIVRLSVLLALKFPLSFHLSDPIFWQYIHIMKVFTPSWLLQLWHKLIRTSNLGGITTTAWEYVRQWAEYYIYDPVITVSTMDIRSNVNGTVAFATNILSVVAG